MIDPNFTVKQGQAVDDLLRENADLRRKLDEAREVIRPFATSYWAVSVDENGWTSGAGKERICDWFDPSDFLAARRWLEDK